MKLSTLLLINVCILIFSGSVQAANFTVINTADLGVGSLREAVASANSTTAGDTIDFNIPANDPGCSVSGVCTITLTTGQIQVASTAIGGALTISNASGPDKLIISGNMSSRVLAVTSNSNFILNGVTITGGNSGGVSNSRSNTTISNSVFTQNTGGYAVAFETTIGNTLTIVNCSIHGNTGGGVHGHNAATAGGKLDIFNSTIAGNSTSMHGAGVRFDGEQMNITNSTISGNTSPSGGGVYAIRGVARLTNVTITNNTGTGALSPEGGGGISVYWGVVEPRNTIIAGNTSMANAPDINFQQNPLGSLNSSGNNLIGNAVNTGLHVMGCAATDICGQPPRVASLGNYGGAQLTHALLPDSRAINAGNNCVLTIGGCGAGDPTIALTTDQRGVARIGNVDIGAFEYTGRSTFDFDGDGKADIAVFRPAMDAFWYVQASSTGFSATYFGTSGDLIAPGDFDGDRKADLSFYRPGNGSWSIRYSGGGPQTGGFFGSFFDLPAPGDFDGDGKTDVTLFNPFTGIWRIFRSTAGFLTVHFGQQDDVPVPADYDGDGKADIAVFRPSTGAWYRIDSSNGQFHGLLFGTSGDLPVPADFDGDTRADEAVFRPSTGAWYLNQSAQGFAGALFGTMGDRPVAADYDADGKADIAVFRPSTGVWYLQRSTQGFFAMRFGQNGDIAVPAAFVP